MEDKRLEKVNDISKSKTLYVAVIILLMAALVITVITAVSLGQVNIKVSDTYKIILESLYIMMKYTIRPAKQ